MRPLTFSPSPLIPCESCDYLTSYSHGGRFYTLREIAHFGANGLWSSSPAWLSRHGTLLATAEAFVRNFVRRQVLRCGQADGVASKRTPDDNGAPTGV